MGSEDWAAGHDPDGSVNRCAAAHGIDFLLTWNYAHMANPVSQARFDTLCEAEGLVAPFMVSPESIPQVRFGQSIRRKR